jgi:hypothetical protein
MVGILTTAVRISWLLCGLEVAPPATNQVEPPPSSPFLGVVYRYADAMLQHGRDKYGPVETGLLLSALDRGTLAPLVVRPAAPAGIRRDDRVGAPWKPLVGANPHHDENLLRVLYTLSELSGQSRYRDAADAELKWFLKNAASPVTHLLPWGEHMSWNVLADEPLPPGDGAVHEFFRPWVLWDRCFELEPSASRAFALGLWEHQVADHNTGAFDRHAEFRRHGPKDGMDFPRHAGFYIRTWASAYEKTGDETFLKAIETLLARFEAKRHPKTGLIEERTGRPNAAPAQLLSLALDCGAAAGVVRGPLAARLRAFAAREDELFCALPHDLKGQGGFVVAVETASRRPVDPPSSLWDARYGGATTASVAMMCVSRYNNGGRAAFADLVVAAADSYRCAAPGEDNDTWPMTFGHAISLELAAWRVTSKPAYLDRARELGQLAVERFWQDSPLPRASMSTGHYETITGADSLALALVELHLSILHITAVRCPPNTIDR